MSHWKPGGQDSAAAGAAAGSGSAEVLPGGNTSGQVVRIGGTVRKRWEPGTRAVHEYLAHLRARGVDVPAPLGRDEQGRQILEHVPGPVRVDAEWMALDDLARVGRLLRSVHDAGTGFQPSIGVEWDPVLLAAVGARARAMHALLRDSHVSGREPWESMFVSGHGEHWREVARYTTEHEELWASCLGVAG